MKTTEELLNELNEEQIQPVLATEGAVLVLAGAGSGKTRVLTTRIAYLMREKDVPARAILAITFTNKAANEMKERVSLLGDVQGMWVCTIHSMCVRILREFADAAGISKNFSIYSETERVNVLKKAYKECAADEEDDGIFKKIKYYVSEAKMQGITPEEFAALHKNERETETVTRVFSAYEKHLKENNALDFDDLLSRTLRLLQTDKEAREYLGGRFRYILVDEFQDTNEVQFEIVRLLSSVHGNLFAVGDDDQSIYGWRGAKIENILHFEKQFPSAQVFKLQRNYRSTKNILAVANETIKNNGRRKQKTLWTEKEEGEKVRVYEADEESYESLYAAKTIRELVREGYSYSDFAVLMRVNALTRSFEQEFTADSIPFKVFGGFKFYDRKEIKDMLAYLRLVANPFDNEALARIVNFPRRGIGAKTMETLEKYAFENGVSDYEALFETENIPISAATRAKLAAFGGQIKDWIISSAELSVLELVKKIVADAGLYEAFSGDDDESYNKKANIEEFVNSVADFERLNGDADLSEYLQQVSLVSDTDEMDESDYVTLATVHAVKGLEFKCVFVTGLEENVLPTSRANDDEEALEEERRVMYVAVTRAKERLYLTRSKSRFLYGKRESTVRSRFLSELSSVVDLPEERRAEHGGYGAYDGYGSGSSYGGRGDYGGYRKTYGGYGVSYGNSSYAAATRDSAPVRSTYKPAYGGGNKSTYGGNAAYGADTYGKTAGTANTASTGGAFTYGGVGFKTPAAKQGKTDVSALKEGVRVSHPKFGTGVIVKRSGYERNVILHVAFEGYGIKQLSAVLAPLKIL
ncbi:MAG: ATP-dependent helicase [Candidatus Scatosoma sp.]